MLQKSSKRKKKRAPLSRSQMMQAVHSKNTTPEVVVRRELFKRGFRYRLYRKDLPGTPDLFILKYNVIVFINGCFWHQHGCKLTTRPKSNKTFWNHKFDSNIARDIKTLHSLNLLGYRVAIVWECSLNAAGSVSQVLERLADFIASDEEQIEI